MNQTPWMQKPTVAPRLQLDMTAPTCIDAKYSSIALPIAEMPAPTLLQPTATVPTNADEHPLRNSCGSCNMAKVKCSRDRPTCQQCASQNTACMYGVSPRGIKRPRPDSQPQEDHHPDGKKRMTSLPSPVLSDIFPQHMAVEITGQAACLPEWSCDDLYSYPFVTDPLDGISPLNTFESSLTDQLALSPAPRNPSTTSSTSNFQSWLGPHMAWPAMTIPPSPTSPPASRDSNTGILSVPGAGMPGTAASGRTPSGLCYCQQTLGYKLTELNLPKQQGAFGFDAFLAAHRANMALCTTVLDCADPQHKVGMVLLAQLIALLFHMVAAFDQILRQGEGPQTPKPRTPHSEHRKEQVAQANLLRAELAKLGALIQEFDRRYCTLDSASWTEDTFLLSPLFANLQWKTQARFDAARSWMPLL